MRIRITSSQKTSRISDGNKDDVKEEISDQITKRVSKKLAKVIYFQQQSKRMPSKFCLDVALKMENIIQNKAESFDDYKRKVMQCISRVQKLPNIWVEINPSFENDLLEDWLMEKFSIRQK